MLGRGGPHGDFHALLDDRERDPIVPDLDELGPARGRRVSAVVMMLEYIERDAHDVCSPSRRHDHRSEKCDEDEDRGVITLVPYRSFEVDCPVCRLVLRAELARLYCDACGGMLIEVDDLVTTIEQLVQIEPEVQFVTGAVGTRPCPRCASPMVMCHLRVAWSDDLRPESYWQSDSSWHYERLARGRTLRSELDRCAAHGVWFDRDELPEIIDRLRVATRSAGVSTRA